MRKITSKLTLLIAFSVATFNIQAQEAVTSGAFSDLNTSSSGQTGIFNSPTVSISNDNFTNLTFGENQESTFPRMFIEGQNAVPRLKQDVLIPVGEGYKFEVAAAYKPIAVTEVRFQIANATSNKGVSSTGEAVPSKWKVQGSNDDATWDDLCEPVSMFSNNSGVDKRTPITLNTTQGYRYYRFVLAEAWMPTNVYTALQHIEWTVDASLSVSDKTLFDNNVSIYPNPTNGFLNIKISANLTVKRVGLVDVTGKEIFNQTNAKPIDVSSFSKGLYILQIESQDGAVMSKKLLVN